MNSQILQQVYEAAKVARKNSHSPYSRFPVGAAFWDEHGQKVWSGCNLENASFNAGICAERAALFGARSQSAQLRPGSW